MGRKVNSNECAEIFEVSAQTVRDWAAAGCPYVKRGGKGHEWTFDTRQVHDWRIERALMEKGVGGAKGDDRTSLHHRKTQADVWLREMEVDRKAGNLIPVGWFIDIISSAFEKCNAKLGSVANRAAPLVAVETDVKKCQRIIERLVNEAREQLVGPTEGSLSQAAIDGTGPRGAARELQAYSDTHSQ